MTTEPRAAGKKMCQGCGEVPGTKELHVCPFQSEINDIDEPICNCCEDCTYECQMDI